MWVVTGDGDAFSIGTNHMIHCMRRNLDVNILLFNNQIYGLTKGQYSPTSEFGKKTKSSPLGTIEQPIHPIELALAAEATLSRARSSSTKSTWARRSRRRHAIGGHRSWRSCRTASSSTTGCWATFRDRSVRDDNWVRLEQGKPIRFGADGRKGIVLRGMEPAVAVVGENGVREEDLLVHDARSPFPRAGVSLGRAGSARFPHGLRHFPPGGQTDVRRALERASRCRDCQEWAGGTLAAAKCRNNLAR